MSHRTRPILVGLALLLAAPGAASSAGKPGGKPPEKITTVEGITEYRLDNGLRVLLFPDASKPTVTVNLTLFVGSRHEGYGESGMAHLLEHMLFKGTPTHPKLWVELQDHGAQFNGTTWTDRTNYFETLPAVAGNLEWAISMEADRLIHSKIAKEDLATEFSVVRNEFEMGENSPGEVLEERLFSSAYLWHNYGRSTIGSRSDIERVPIENLQGFYRKYYQPDNAMVVVAGKFEPNEALNLVVKHFGSIARPERVLPDTYTIEPVQDGEREVLLRRTGDVALAGLVYHGVAGGDPEFVAEDALVYALTEKPSGRLYKALVESGMAAEIGGDAYVWAEPGLVKFMAKVRADQDPSKVQGKMIEMVEGLGKAPITADEVARYKAAYQKQFDLLMTRSDRIGVQLSEWAAIGDWRMLFVYRDRVKALKPEQVNQFAAKFLKSSNRTAGLFLPTKTPDRSPVPARPDVASVVKDYKGEASSDEGEAFEATLDNIDKRTKVVKLPVGMKLAMLPKKTRGKGVRLLLSMRVGSLADLKGRATSAGMVAAMLPRGTTKHSFQQIKEELDRLRADVRFSGDDGMGDAATAQVRITTVRESLPAVLDLVNEMLRQPAFPAAELEVVRRDALAKLEEALSDPNSLARTALARRYAPYPSEDPRYEPTIQERIERIRAVKIEEVQKAWKDLWGAGGASLVAIGDFDDGALQAQAKKLWGDWKAQKPYARIEEPFVAGAAAEEDINTPDKEMAIVLAGHSAQLREDDPAFPAMMLSNFVFGGSTRSWLLERLRQKEGLSYGAFSAVASDPYDKNAMILAGAICAPQNAAKALASLLDEWNRLVSGGIPEKELGEAKAAWKITYDGRLAQDDALLGIIDRNLYAGRGFAFQKNIVSKIAALTTGEVAAAIKKFIEPARLVKVKAGDLNKKAQ